MFGWLHPWKKKRCKPLAEPDPAPAFDKKGRTKIRRNWHADRLRDVCDAPHVARRPAGAGAFRVNFGQNIAEDVSYSGTVAGAKEGTVFGIPSVALSQAISLDSRHKIRFEVGVNTGPLSSANCSSSIGRKTR